MSQFIDLQTRYPLQSAFILKGILSKVIQPSTRLSSKRKLSHIKIQGKSTATFFNSTMDRRFIQQVKKADSLHHNTIGSQYRQMKRKLFSYGKSSFHRIHQIVRDGTGPPQRYFDDDQYQPLLPSRKLTRSTNHISPMKLVEKLARQRKQTKLRYSVGKIHSQINNHDTTVFVDRKYDKEFSIKMGAIVEAEGVNEMKEKYKEFVAMNNRATPLVRTANSLLNKRHHNTQYEKSSIEVLGLRKTQSSWSRSSYHPRRKTRTPEDSLLITQIPQKIRQISMNFCKNKLSKSLSCNIRTLKSPKIERFSGQNQVRQKHIRNSFDSLNLQRNNATSKPQLNNIRKRQKKITWKKQIKA